MHSFSERRMMMIWSLCFIFSLFNLMFVFASPAMHLCRPDQRDALWAFKGEFSIQESYSNRTTGRWRNNTDCCFWDGVSCDPKTGNVAELNFWGIHLNGPLKSNSSLFRLQHLQRLDFRYTDFWSSVLPNSIGNLKYLRFLRLTASGLHGNIPSSLGNLSHLTYLYLSGNNFTGELPDSIGNLNQLTTLLLGENELSGNFPLMLLNLSELTRINLGSNQFEGMLPSNMISLSKLAYFDISRNSFSGSIPPSLFMIPSLVYLELSENDFSGSLEIVNISSPSKIEELWLGGNNFSGPIPGSISKLVGLLSLDLSFWNTERGILDFSIFMDFKSLAILHLSHLNTRSMVDLSLNTICKLVSLRTLDLSNNNFSGSIPRCFNPLQVLNLRNNSLSGILPEESVGADLISLDVGHNQLSGELPKSLINCTGLVYLNVEENRFNDTFPILLSFLPNLMLLVLRSNELHGPIYSYGDPLGFPGFPMLRIFDISENRFSGVLPSDYFEFWNAMMSSITVDPNVITVDDQKYDSIDSLAVTNKGLKMELVGRILIMYKTIDVSGNKFEGDIPESIGLLKGLIGLNMSNNAFTGPIPLSIVNLNNLESLDLSQNRLSGELPPRLGKLMFIARMNFSYNRLEGPIPQGTQIQSQHSSSFAENPGLCGAPLEKTCGSRRGGEEEEATKQEEDEEKDQVLSWVAAAISYVPGVFCGLTIGHILASYKHDWFMRMFHSST